MLGASQKSWPCVKAGALAAIVTIKEIVVFVVPALLLTRPIPELLRRRPQADLLHCVSDGEWKLIYRPSYPEESELYRLSDDPGEERNLWAEAHDHRRRLLSELARHAGWVLEPLQGAGGTLSPLAQEILEDLGYAGDAEQPSSSDSGWSWFCPGDDVRREEAGSCPSCGAPTVPRARD